MNEDRVIRVDGADVTVSPVRLRCDFCSAPDPIWEYTAKEFTIDVPRTDYTANMDPRWAACGTCRALVDMGDREALLMRSARQQAIIRGLPPNRRIVRALKPEIKALQDKFWEGKSSDAFPLQRRQAVPDGTIRRGPRG